MTRVGGLISGAAVTIGVTAAQIAKGQSGRKSIVIQNHHATNDLWIGDANVTTATGIRVRASETVSFDDYNGPLYGIASGASTDVRYLEVRF